MRKIMNIDSEFLLICRTCLGKGASNPIFSNDAGFSEIVQITTGIKVDTDDGLPQSICQYCLNTINNCLDFRRQCKDAEKELLTMKSRVKSYENIVEIKSETTDMEIGSKNVTSMESEYKQISFENTTIKYEDNVSKKTDCNKMLLSNSSNDKNSQTNNDITNDIIITSNNHLETKTLVCELCKEAIAIRNFRTCISAKYNLSEINTLICKKCNAHLNRKKRRKNSHFDNYIVLNRSMNVSNVLHDSDIKSDRENENTINGNSKKCKDISRNTCSAFKSENVNVCNEIQNNDTLLSKNSSSVNEVFCNDTIKIKMEPGYTEIPDNIFYTVNNTDPQRVTCKLCQKDLSKRSIDSHVSRHHPGVDKRRVKCDLCRSYMLKSKLTRHVVMMHGSGSICRYCKSEFGGKEALVGHISSCSAKRRRNRDSSRELAQCEVCHRTMQKGSLKLHRAMKHAGLRPVCEHCGRSFGNKLRLHDHYRAKHGYEKFKCKLCDFQSACAVSLTNHERRHRGEKPFVCEACGAKFHAAYLLTQHRQSHAKHSTYKCNLCPASFKVNNTLHMHKRACHSTSQHACTTCARVFSTRAYLARHMRAVHARAVSTVDHVPNVPPMQTDVTNVSPVQNVSNVSPVQNVLNVSPMQNVPNVSPVV